MLPEFLFDSPQVGRLTSKGRAMDAPQGREEMTEVSAKISEHRLVLIQAEVLADGLDGQHFRVRKPWLRPALAQRLAVKRDSKRIVHSAEDCYNQSVQVHDEPPSGERQTLPLKGLVAWTSTFQRTKTCTRG